VALSDASRLHALGTMAVVYGKYMIIYRCVIGERILSPEANARFLAARQQHDQPDVGVVNVAHVPVAAISLALVVFVVAFGQPERFGLFARALCATILLALLGNATICGVLSNPNDRYQGRMVWLASLPPGSRSAAGGNAMLQHTSPSRSGAPLAKTPPYKKCRYPNSIDAAVWIAPQRCRR